MKRPDFGDQQTFSIVRGADVSVMSLVLAEVEPPGTPGGPCRQGNSSVAMRRLNTVLFDPGGMALLDPNKSGAVMLGRGTYECSFSVPSYMVGRFSASLMTLDTKQVLIRASQEFSGGLHGYAQTRAHGVGRFRLVNRSTMVGVVESCEQDLPGDATLKALALGVPNGFGPEVYSLLQCRIVHDRS